MRGELNVVRVLPMRQHRHSQVIITAPLATQTTSSPLPTVAPTVGQTRFSIHVERTKDTPQNIDLFISINGWKVSLNGSLSILA